MSFLCSKCIFFSKLAKYVKKYFFKYLRENCGKRENYGKRKNCGKRKIVENAKIAENM